MRRAGVGKVAFWVISAKNNLYFPFAKSNTEKVLNSYFFYFLYEPKSKVGRNYISFAKQKIIQKDSIAKNTEKIFILNILC